MPGRSSGNLLDRWNDPGGKRITTDDITPSDGAQQRSRELGDRAEAVGHLRRLTSLAPEGKGSRVRIGSVVVDCNDFAGMVAFWREALGYVAREPAEDGWVVLRDPGGANVNVSFQQVPEPRSGKNRLHFDLYTDDQAGEVERLLTLGATRHPRNPEPGDDFVVLEDPEGNLFCVVDTSGTAEPGGSGRPALA